MSGQERPALSGVGDRLGAGLRRILARGRQTAPDLYDELVDTLVLSDAGVDTATAIVEQVKSRAERSRGSDAAGLRQLLAEVVADRLGPGTELTLPSTGLGVILIVGVNGVGKTTTMAKLAAHLVAAGRRPLLVQADTFRAAATEQALVWATRLGLEVVHHRPGSDPAAVAFDGVRAALARDRDTILVDTAGRLHNKAGLVEELKKVRRVLAREVTGAPHETLLVLDGTAGLNSLEQARVFHEAVTLSGVIITKLEGTARGGVVLAIRGTLGVPVKFVGLGEGLEDLTAFDPQIYARAMLGLPR